MLVELATDGPGGLEAARHGDYDAVVLDVMLPGMSGYNVVRTLRTEENWVPVLVLSGKDGEYDQADGLDYGADDYLTKPFSFVVLLALLRALGRRKMPARPSILTVSDLTLDPATHEVELAGTPVALTPREYALLEYFLRHPGRVVSKTELLDNVWDAAENVDLDGVGVYVLRCIPDVVQKLGLADGAARVAQEVLQQGVLARGQGHWCSGDLALMAGRIQRDVTGREDRRAGRQVSPGQCPEPRQQHHEGEGLGEVVVGCVVPTIGLVVLAVLGRKHQDGHPVRLGAQ